MNFKANVLLFSSLFLIGTLFGCKKIDRSLKPTDAHQNEIDAPGSFNGSYISEPVSNDVMLRYVLTGSGGPVCETDEGIVEMPTYRAPIFENDMLSFASIDDLENYQDALDILLIHWHYSDVDYEETPEEINHLGDEPLNAVDSAFGFSSLRSQYELNDFTLNEGWENDDPLYVDDDDYQNVLNRNHEVKIGDDYIKHIGYDMYAKVENNNYSRLLDVRNIGYSSVFLSDVKLHDEVLGQDVTPPQVGSTNGDCPYVTSRLTINPVTAVPNSGNGSWEVEMIFTPIFYFNTIYVGAETLTGDFTIDWLDGSPLQSFSGVDFRNPFKIKHTYFDNFAPGVEKTKTARINFTITAASSGMLARCPNLVGEAYEFVGSIKLLNSYDCNDQAVKRLFYSTETNFEGNTYRMKMKLKQKVQRSWFARKSKFEGVLVLQKRSGNKWKKVKPPYQMGLHLKGEVYSVELTPTCTQLAKSLNERVIRGSAKKIKIKYKPDRFTHGLCSTPKTSPLYLNADYFFTNSGGQSVTTINKTVLD